MIPPSHDSTLEALDAADALEAPDALEGFDAVEAFDAGQPEEPEGGGAEESEAAEPEPSYPPGTILDETYSLAYHVASGGMGEIYAAEHARLPGLFVVKILQASLVTDADIMERFRREADVMATLRHPHVAQVLDFRATSDGRPYLVMEHVDGSTLAELVTQRGPLSPALTAQLVRQIAAALAAAHAQGIVHLDLKPDNVMVLPDHGDIPFVKVIDFGIAKSRHSPARPSKTIIGTPEYMSPEQIQGTSDLIDGRSDQFSLAVMAFVLLTGHGPWGAEDSVTTLYRICQDPPQTLANYLALPMPAIEAALHRALSKDPALRFTSITEFARAFEAAVVEDTASGQLPGLDLGTQPGHALGATLLDLPPLAPEPSYDAEAVASQAFASQLVASQAVPSQAVPSQAVQSQAVQSQAVPSQAVQSHDRTAPAIQSGSTHRIREDVLPDLTGEEMTPWSSARRNARARSGGRGRLTATALALAVGLVVWLVDDPRPRLSVVSPASSPTQTFRVDPPQTSSQIALIEKAAPDVEASSPPAGVAAAPGAAAAAP